MGEDREIPSFTNQEDEKYSEEINGELKWEPIHLMSHLLSPRIQ